MHASCSFSNTLFRSCHHGFSLRTWQHRFATRKRSRRDAALLRSTAVGADISALTTAWCACTWGLAGAEVAATFAVAHAVIQNVIGWSFAASANSAQPLAVQHNDGGTYDGEWAQQRKSGLGVYRYASGAIYEGEWSEGQKHGYGVHVYPDGGRFEGAFEAGQRSGLGVRTWPSGVVRVRFFTRCLCNHEWLHSSHT